MVDELIPKVENKAWPSDLEHPPSSHNLLDITQPNPVGNNAEQDQPLLFATLEQCSQNTVFVPRLLQILNTTGTTIQINTAPMTVDPNSTADLPTTESTSIETARLEKQNRARDRCCELVMELKCKLCEFICRSRGDMIEHLRIRHQISGEVRSISERWETFYLLGLIVLVSSNRGTTSSLRVIMQNRLRQKKLLVGRRF